LLSFVRRWLSFVGQLVKLQAGCPPAPFRVLRQVSHQR
jgi:hypothetical protein